MNIFVKYLLTSAIVVLVSEVAKRSDKAGALISSLPLVTVLVMIWLFFDAQPLQKISNHAFYTFWYVIPTLPMFLLIPWMLGRGYGFWISLAAGVVLTFVSFFATSLAAKPFGVDLGL